MKILDKHFLIYSNYNRKVLNDTIIISECQIRDIICNFSEEGH